MSYQFVLDSQNYSDQALRRSIPTLILHGQQDEVIPLSASQKYVQSRSWVELIVLDSDHGLGNALPEIWSKIQLFCHLN